MAFRYLTLVLAFCLSFESFGAVTLGPWIQRNSGVTTPLWAIVEGPDVFVAGGDDGVLLKSLDRQNWRVVRSASGGAHIRGLAYGNGIYIAAATGGNYFRSTDGEAWALVRLLQ